MVSAACYDSGGFISVSFCLLFGSCRYRHLGSSLGRVAPRLEHQTFPIVIGLQSGMLKFWGSGECGFQCAGY